VTLPAELDLDRLVPLREAGGRPPLYCVHAVSGSAYSYAGLARLLPPDQPVLAFEAPGFDGEREPVGDLPALSAEYAEILRRVQPEGGYRLLGWSFGGTLAFDMAQQLTAAGLEVRDVILVDTSLPWVARLPPEREIQRRFLLDLAGIAGAGGEQIDESLARLPEDVEPARTFARVEADGFLADLDADILEERYVVFRAHLGALFAFEVTAAYDGPVLHIIAEGSDPKYMRWDKVATDLTEMVVPGGHHSIWHERRLPRLAELVRERISSRPGCATGVR
jgi:thioesterase domain-containing protein